MKLHRILAVLLVAASFSGGVLAQRQAQLDDETIFLAVEQALREARAFAAADITVRSREGYVTLSGSARSLHDIAAAGRIAARVRGVTGVKNDLRVADRPWRA